jgi:hypothetical protein
MNKFYSLLGATLVLALSANAQSQTPNKLRTNAERMLLTAPGATPSKGAHANNLRGGGPANDNCSSATTEVLSIPGSVNFSGDNTGATEDGDFEPGSGLEGFGPCVWHKFSIASCANISVAYCGTNPAYQNLAAFLARTCPATDADYILYTAGDFSLCGDDNGTIFWDAVPAGEYWLPVLLDEANSAIGPYSITVSAEACPAAPANDECAGAIQLTSDVNCVVTYFNTTGATETLPPIECMDFTSGNAFDVFFMFTATSTDHTISVGGFDDADAMVELFSGSCGSLVSMQCEDATYPQTADLEYTSEVMLVSGLTVGTTYYVRVYDWGHASPSHAFEICLTEGAGSNIGIEENASSDWSLFPNPGTGVFTINYVGASGLGNIEVMDVTGRVMYNVQAQLATGSTHSMDLSGLAAGNYTVRITNNGVRTEQRLVVK